MSTPSVEIVVLVAPAASGKSSLSRKFTQHYRINQDALKSLDKCVKVAKSVLLGSPSGLSVLYVVFLMV